LARAGLARLNRLDEIAEVLPDSVMLSAVGQGALAIVTREGDAATRGALRNLDDSSSHAEVLAERSFLARLEAGCRGSVAARARVREQNLEMTGGVFSIDGSQALREDLEGEAMDAESIGRELADRLLARGAARWIEDNSR
jgi:hydroxymethylbilane synthase